ncbi:DUF418 domain-containing protein [Thalassotalea marina]|uniref:DUF418 domain-containing protein n=1 Tax=Thalassotalea marina TaxID=1673741 RepID=A0A919BI89_9GAMM|nr:DUF418 domain-containing protein [Thalassotalea marina]GHF89656.1 hypothetical protein GCM10017161_16910 [Thalassotalea marina]
MNNFGGVTHHRERIELLDIVRGFALCGIIFANLMSFTGFYSLDNTQIQLLPMSDRIVLSLIDWLIEGKFYSVFAMLFGAGFAIIYQKKSDKTKNFNHYWLKRMSILLLIGILHMSFIWHGDILILYSLLGMSLLVFIRCTNTQLISIGVALLLTPMAIHVIAFLTADNPIWSSFKTLALTFKSYAGFADVELLAMRTSDDPFQVFVANIYSAIPRPMSYLITGRPFQVLGQFLIGIYLIRLFFLSDKPFVAPTQRTTIWLLVIGALLNIQYAFIKYLTGSPFSLNLLGLYQGLVYHLGAIVMALGYMAGLYHLFHSNAKPKINWLASLGRMSLTVYLMQTSLCVMLFYGYGLALMGTVPQVSIIAFGCTILLCQTVFATWWFSVKQQGPIEYLWRKSIGN